LSDTHIIDRQASRYMTSRKEGYAQSDCCDIPVAQVDFLGKWM